VILAAVVTALSLLAPAPTVVAAGDVATCRSSGDEATADLVASIPGTVAVLGDAVYERGTAAEFRDCYSWARFRKRTRAALGNHEYATGTADVAVSYFGLPRRGYYAYRLGAWQVVVLNTNCAPAGGCETGSPQQRWLAATRARSRARCTLAYGHHPRFSSGLHGSDRTIAALWSTLARGGADVYLAGHDHHYERFAPVAGIRSFVVGTGGSESYAVATVRPNSEVQLSPVFGVLRLTLAEGSYRWSFLAAQSSGARTLDAGEGHCH